ncbi:MAG: chromosomal replication initiator protein DnaA [Dehalococcoidales bacterium]|nr:chromosomal replication initiator protein DnaA [Dehalococcoidales bacterium]
MNNRPAQELWETALGELQVEVNKANFYTWFQKTRGVSFADGIFTIGVPNTFVAEYLEKNQYSLIEKVLTGVLHADVRLAFSIDNGVPKLLADRPDMPLFNPKYTFGTFVTANSNNLAFAAANQVAENPGQNFNPLYIHGGSGLGKTHLLHAIGNEAAGKHLNALCVSAEQYTNELVSSIRARTTEEFRNKYRSVDILLLDDIQFFGGKEQTEENFFHTFNELHSNGSQIVVTSDRPPKEIPQIKDKLLSRLEGGLVADLQPPDFDTRVSILQAKAKREGVEIGEDVLEYIALQIKENIRALEGSLNRVVAYSKLLRTMITPDMAARAIDSIASKAPQLAPVTPGLIIETVAGAFQMNISDIKGRRRDNNTVIARQVCMYLIRQETDSSLTDIGRELGGRSPATISYAYEKMSGAINNDPLLRRQVFNIQQKLHTTKAG